jgi:hypothetical protein
MTIIFFWGVLYFLTFTKNTISLESVELLAQFKVVQTRDVSVFYVRLKKELNLKTLKNFKILKCALSKHFSQNGQFFPFSQILVGLLQYSKQTP